MGRFLICFVILLLSCGSNHESLIKESLRIISEEIKQQQNYLFESLMTSPVKYVIPYIKKIYEKQTNQKFIIMSVLYFFSKVQETNLLLTILNDESKPADFRLFAFHLLAEKNDIKIFKSNIENYITHRIINNDIQHLIENKVEFYSHLPFTNKLVVNAVKKIFLQSTNYIECYTAFNYLNKLHLIDNRDLLLKIPEVEDPLRSMLLTKIDTSKDISLLRSVIEPAINEPKGEQFFLVLLMLADELSISKFKYRDLFRNPQLLNNIFDKESIAITALLSGKARGDSYEEYLSYILQSSIKKERNAISNEPPIFDIISHEKKEPRITKIIQYLLKNGDEEVIYKLLRGRQLQYSEIPLVGKHLKSNNKELRLLAALRIVRASELHERK